jgi:DNA-binding IclR family transcriptional regulator
MDDPGDVRGRRGRSNAGPVDTGVGTLDRAVAILEAVEAGAHSFTLIAESTGLPRSSAHRLIRALERHGFLAAYGGFGYRLGPRLLRLASTAMSELSLRDVAHPILERLTRSTGESAQLFVRSGDVRVCIDAVESRSELRTIVPIGASLPLHAGSAGKVFLSVDPDRARHIGMSADPTRFLRDVQMVPARGWASSIGEREPGVGSVSAPIRGSRGALLAAVSVSGPVSRMGRASVRRLAPSVVGAAQEIEAALGVPPG